MGHFLSSLIPIICKISSSNLHSFGLNVSCITAFSFVSLSVSEQHSQTSNRIRLQTNKQQYTVSTHQLCISILSKMSVYIIRANVTELLLQIIQRLLTFRINLSSFYFPFSSQMTGNYFLRTFKLTQLTHLLVSFSMLYKLHFYEHNLKTGMLIKWQLGSSTMVLINHHRSPKSHWWYMISY